MMTMADTKDRFKRMDINACFFIYPQEIISALSTSSGLNEPSIIEDEDSKGF